jgi:hypothetical protein
MHLAHVVALLRLGPFIGCDDGQVSVGHVGCGKGGKGSNILLGPLVLAADLVLLLGGEVVLDVKGFANLLWGLSLDHVGDGLAAHVEEGLDIEVVGSLGEVSGLRASDGGWGREARGESSPR